VQEVGDRARPAGQRDHRPRDHRRGRDVGPGPAPRGDAVTADLGRSYDGVLCFNLVHHLQPEQIVGLLRRIHDALAPGGSLAVMDQVQTPAELHGWLAEAGFGAPRRIPILCIPGPARYVVTRR
jgi:hypothetical protein